MQTQLLSTAGGTQPCTAQASWHPGAGFCPGREHLLLGWVPERSRGPLPSRPPSSTHPTPPGSGTQQQHLGHARPSPEGPRSDQRSCRGRSAGVRTLLLRDLCSAWPGSALVSCTTYNRARAVSTLYVFPAAKVH